MKILLKSLLTAGALLFLGGHVNAMSSYDRACIPMVDALTEIDLRDQAILDFRGHRFWDRSVYDCTTSDGQKQVNWEIPESPIIDVRLVNWGFNETTGVIEWEAVSEYAPKDKDIQLLKVDCDPGIQNSSRVILESCRILVALAPLNSQKKHNIETYPTSHANELTSRVFVYASITIIVVVLLYCFLRATLGEREADAACKSTCECCYGIGLGCQLCLSCAELCQACR